MIFILTLSFGMSTQTTISKVIRPIVSSSYKLDDYNRFFLNFLISVYQRLTFYCRSFFCSTVKNLANGRVHLLGTNSFRKLSSIIIISNFQRCESGNFPNVIISNRLCNRLMLCAITKINSISYKN